MSVNLLHTVIAENENGETNFSQNWSAVTEITGKGGYEGLLELADETITEIARLLESEQQSNGKPIFTYIGTAEEEWLEASYVGEFAPSMLGEEAFRAVRTILEADANGIKAVALFDLIARLEILVGFNGKDHCFARMRVTNAQADDVDVNRCVGNMAYMFKALGLGHTEKDECSDIIPLEVFEKAVNDNGHLTDMPQRLKEFVACAKRSGSTHVYWA